MMALALLAKYQPALLSGLFVTASLSLVVWGLGLGLGGALGIAGTRWSAIGKASRTASFLIGSLPAIVVLIWCYYPAQALLGVIISPFWTAAFALSIINILIVSDIVRPALVNFPQEFVVAGKVSGMSEAQVFRHITFPLVIRQLLPPILFSQVSMLHATLFASLISVEEVFRVTQEINAQEYQPVALYTTLALVFLAICAPINGIALYLRHRYGRDLSER
jgi:ABC-type amino acid transport system permease subunit